MKMTLLLALGTVLVGCSGVPEPLVDHTGIDEGRYSRDLADCARTQPFIAAGNPDADCLRGKGYVVLLDR